MTEVPKGFQWVDIADAQIFHSEENARLVIMEELKRIDQDVVPNFRVPWALPGWFKETSAWMRDELRSWGSVVTEPVVQLRASPWGTVLRASAESKHFYLKGSPLFCDEGKINDVLSRVAPLYVSKPLVVDKERRAFITGDHGKCAKDMDLSKSEKQQIMRDFANQQKASATKVNELRNAGLQLYETSWVADNLDYMLDHDELSSMNDSDAIQRLKRNRAKIRDTLLTLKQLTSGIPMALIHGDLRRENIYRSSSGSGKFGFFDWDSAFIGLPLLGVRDWLCGRIFESFVFRGMVRVSVYVEPEGSNGTCRYTS